MDFSNLNIIKLKDNIFRVEKKNGKQIYVGHLKKNKPHGYGEYISKIDNYKGYWKNGIREGKGMSTYFNGNIYYNGYWENDLPNGTGIFYYKNKKKEYKGSVKNGLYNDHGVLYYPNGQKKYRGEFFNSKYHGFGILYYEKGDEVKHFEGEWKNNQKNGKVKEFNKKGDIIFEGEYKKNKKNGYGYIYKHNFPFEYTFWKNDILIKTPYKPFPKNLVFQKKIGDGGFGNIDLYKNKKNGKLYAVKSLVSRRSEEEHHLVLQNRNLEFLKEKKVCKPYFICPYGIYKDGKTIKLVCNYLKGYETFKEFRKKSLPFEKRKYICSQMLKELNILHHIGMIHSDIKPENIMIDPKTLKVRIIDFGIAIIIDTENKEKKYEIYGFTARYFHINIHEKHNFMELRKNDIKALSTIIYPYLSGDHKDVSFPKRFQYIEDNLLR